MGTHSELLVDCRKERQHCRREHTTRQPRPAFSDSHGISPRRRPGYGITVNSVCPGLIDTEMVRDTISDDRADAYAASFPIQRLGQPEEVAELVAFLASDRASYITGASLDINGGDLMI